MFPTTIKLSQYFRVPEYVAGYLEWGTGIIRVNMDYELWERYSSGKSAPPPESFRSLCSTITHETYHFLQIAVTGFMYRFASRYFEAMHESVSAHAGNELTEESIYSFLTKPPSISDKVGSLLRVLHHQGPTGVSALHIIESAAFFYEHNTHFKNLTAVGYNKILEDEDPPEEYFLAYHEAERVLGSLACDNFLIATVISLCFAEPQNVFPDVLRCIKSVGIPYRNFSDYPKFIMSVQELMKKYAVLGTSAEYMVSSGTRHPIYQKAIHGLMADTASPVDLVSRPDAMSLEAARAHSQPIVFNRNHILIPPAFRERYGQETAEQELQGIIWIAAMFMAHGSEGQRPTKYFYPKEHSIS